MGNTIRSSSSFPFFRFHLTPSIDEIEEEEERERETKKKSAGAAGAATSLPKQPLDEGKARNDI
jgi:hypothetical protein